MVGGRVRARPAEVGVPVVNRSDGARTPLSRGAAGRLAGVFFGISGVVTMLSPILPAPEGMNRVGVALIGAAATIGGLLFFVLPWERLPRWVGFVSFTLSANVLIAFHNFYGGLDPYRYSLFFSVLYVLLGLTQPRGRAALAVPVTAAAYVTPLMVQGLELWTVTSAMYALPVFVLIGESIAYFGSWLATTRAEMERQAFTDSLTGLPNRAAFYQWLRADERSREQGSEAVAVVFVDLDSFKPVNDRYGHVFGDRLLCTVAGRLQAAVRPGDRVARLGGDEFAVLLEDIDGVADATGVGERIVAGLGEPLVIGDRTVSISASVGVSVGRREDLESDEMVRTSDGAMYEAKRAGGGAYVLHDASRFAGPAEAAGV